MKPEEREALRLILSVIQPPVVAQLAASGGRDTWAQLINAAAVLEPLTIDPEPEKPA